MEFLCNITFKTSNFVYTQTLFGRKEEKKCFLRKIFFCSTIESKCYIIKTFHDDYIILLLLFFSHCVCDTFLFKLY